MATLAAKPKITRRQYRFNKSRMLSKGVTDGRSRNARFMAAVREELTTHLGGEKITPTQRILIERIAWLQLHVALFDKKVEESGDPLTITTVAHIWPFPILWSARRASLALNQMLSLSR